MIKRIVGGVTASALALLGFASAAQAQASPPDRPAGPVPTSHVINLHQAYLRALPAVKAGTISGVVYALGRAPRAAAASLRNSGCSEPNCPLAYGGGPVQQGPRVYLLLWGRKWSTNRQEKASATYLERFYAGLGVQPKDNWSAITSQYTDASGAFPMSNGSVYMGAYQDTSTPPRGLGQRRLQSEADAFATSHHLTHDVNTQIVIATQSGTCPSGYYAPNCAGGSGSYCAYHAYSPTTGVTFTNLPYLLDAGAGCGEHFVNRGRAGVNDGWSIVGGHEYAETITDPVPTSGWIDLNDSSGGEIGDKCAWGGQIWGSSDPSGDVRLSTGSFAMQSLWSNAANACVMSAARDSVTVASPGNQSTAPGTPVSLQISAGSSTSAPLEYEASGLPKSLSISSGGLITGTPGVGAYKVRVAAGDTTGAVGVATFAWTVGNPVVKGLITGFRHRCVQDYRARTRDGNKIDVWGCTRSQRRAETWTVGSHTSLQIMGKCLTDPNNGKAGTRVLLEKCTGAKDQIWHHRANGEWAVASHYLCLTIPNRNTRNGAALAVDACRHTVAQRWSMP